MRTSAVIRAVAVIVPASNEQDDVGACLDAVAVARRQLHQTARHPVSVRTVVVLDSCTDGTAAVVARYPDVQTLEVRYGQVGAVRAAGARYALDTSPVSSRQLWLANTDADSTVCADWLSRMVEEAERGAHLVLGTVLPAPGLPASVARAWHGLHDLHDGHPHIHGANFGIRADIHAALGGWPALATGEDEHLAARAASAGHLRVVRTAGIPVVTSTRRTGRAPKGFAGYLSELRSATGGQLADAI